MKKATQESEQILHPFPQKETTTTKKSPKFLQGCNDLESLIITSAESEQILHRSPQKETTTIKKSAKFSQGCNDLEGFEKVS